MRLRVEEIEQGVASLPQEQLAEFRSWFERFDTEQWDQQIQQDVAAGKLDHFADAAIQQHRQGKSKPL